MNVLAIGAHPDDIELGCGGTLLRHVDAGDRVTMLVMTRGERGRGLIQSRTREQGEAARLFSADLRWGGLPDCGIPHDERTVARIDEVIADTQAEIVYTHSPHDTHQDHVITAACSMSAARHVSRVLCYQSPSSTSFAPGLFVDIEPALAGKLEALRCHLSQVLHCAFVDLEAVEATARYWGFKARGRFAEPFEIPRFVWDIPGRAAQQTGSHSLRTVEQPAAAPAMHVAG